ncbi:MAG: hypothetical protein KC413_23135 [Anaerolineales bacterium]|nr:hypothetical protein [Anaerolineales bacterium]
MEKQETPNVKLLLEDNHSASTLKQILSAHSGNYHAIVLQDFPDPDAISCAYTHQLISTEYGIETDILYAGRVSHEQNIALVRLLDLELVKYQGELPRQYDAAVFIDNQGTTCEAITTALEKAGVTPLIVIDHHEPQDRLQPTFLDVRAVGATATIYAGYLTEGVIEMNPAKKEFTIAATGLMHGLITDTNNFIHAGKADFQAAAYLSQFVDAPMLDQIMNQSHTKQVMEVIHKALGNRILVENFSIAGAGYLRAEDRDAIPQAADFLLTEGIVHTAIVYGIVIHNDQVEKLEGSMRTSKLTINPDEFIKEACGKNTAGHYYGGG